MSLIKPSDLIPDPWPAAQNKPAGAVIAVAIGGMIQAVIDGDDTASVDHDPGDEDRRS